MAIVEGGDGLFAALKQWVADDKPASHFASLVGFAHRFAHARRTH